MKLVKVFVEKAESPAFLKDAEVVERYPAFVIVKVSDEQLKAIARKYPIEDISSLYRLQLSGKTVDTLREGPALRTAKRKAASPRLRAKLSPGPHHYVVQFVGPIKQTWLSGVRATGAKLRAPFGGLGYVVRATDVQLQKISALKYVLWVGHLPHADRLAPGLATTGKARTSLPRRRTRPGVYTVEAFDSGDVGSIARAARSLGFKVLSTDSKARVMLLQAESGAAQRRKKLEDLSTVHGVRYIRERVIPRTANNVATTIMGNKYSAVAATGLKLSGSGEIVAVCDTGLDTGDQATIHPDFAGRIVAIKSYPITPDWSSVIFNPQANDGPADLDSGHGTHVAGSVLGDGTASSGAAEFVRGHAHKAKLVFQAIEQEMSWRPNAPASLRSERFILSGIPTNLRPLFQFAYGQGARIHSNSWGGGDAGEYDDQCRQFDQFVWDNKDFSFVIAAGNDGADTDADGQIDPMSVSSPGTAKNCVTVGACENLRPDFNAERYGDWWPGDFPANPPHSDPMANNAAQVVAFSSRGPTRDGRTKPEVIAPGTFILSTRSTQLAPNNFAWAAYPPNKKYFYMGGTSMATPLTAGALALLREFLRKKQGLASPSAALVKALLIAGAQRLPGTAATGYLLDNHQGYGRVNVDRSVRRVLATIEGAGLATGQKSTISILVPTSTKTLRIALAYTDFPGDTLINNLNLVVTDPAGKRFVGNQRNVAGNTLALDTANNVELVQASNARKGKWTVDVIASNVASGPQDFAIAAVLV